MSQKTNIKLTGMFVLTAAFILIGTFLLINRDNLSSHSLKYVLYFEGSVKGLSVGAPVVLNGVPVGRVANISLITDVKDLSFKIPVTIEINTRNFQKRKAKRVDSLWKIEYSSRNSQIKMMHELVEKGLRARLITQSILTGQMMIELSFYPDTQPVFRGGDGNVLEIPTLPSSISEFTKALQNLPIHKMAVNLNETLSELRILLQTINANAPQTTANVTNISKSVNAILSPNSPTVTDLNKFLKEASAAAQSLHNWADYLERHPEALLKGKGGY